MATPGNFSFIGCDMWRKSCTSCYKSIDGLGLWEWLSSYNPPRGFCVDSHPNSNLIESNLDFNPHSGASWGCMMREMQYIAKNGWDAYVILKTGE